MNDERPAAVMTSITSIERLVPIPDAGTLSKVIHTSAGVRVVAFAFDAAQELTEHTAAVPVLLHVVTGRLTVQAGETTAELTPGGLVHLPAKLAHSVRAIEPTVLVLTMLQPSTT